MDRSVGKFFDDFYHISGRKKSRLSRSSRHHEDSDQSPDDDDDDDDWNFKEKDILALRTVDKTSLKEWFKLPCMNNTYE